MKVINLDKFNTHQKVMIGGKTYEVKGTTVQQFLDDADEDNTNLSTVEQFEVYVRKLVRISDIPEEILKNQQPPVLFALLQVSQGIDPTEEKENGDSTKK